MSWQPWTVEWDEHAGDTITDLAKRDQRQADRIVRAVLRYAAEGHGDVKKLEGYGDRWRQRVGDWRVIFRRQSPSHVLLVLNVTLRRDAYR